MNLPIFHLNKSIVSKPTNHHSPSRHNTDEQHKDYLFKKYLRGKLVKLINHSIIREDQPSSDSSSDELEEELLIPKPKNKVFVTNTFPNIIGSEIKATKRKYDHYVTPKELITDNFSKDEINLIKSDPNYFKLNLFEPFKNLDLIKNKTLLQRINDEESMGSINKSKKTVKFKIIKETSKQNESTEKNLYFPLINTNKNSLDNKHEKFSHISSISNHKSTKTHSQKSFSSDFSVKFNKYIQRKKTVKERISNSILKKIEDKTEKYKRNLIESEKENKENHLINQLKIKIKKSYLK